MILISIIKGECAFIISFIFSFFILFFNTRVFDFFFFITHNPMKDDIFISSSFNSKYFINKTLPVFMILLNKSFFLLILIVLIIRI